MKNSIILFVAILVLVAFPFLYYINNAENPNIYLQCLTAATVFFFGYAAYKFQQQTHEFNRLDRVPHLNVDRTELEQNKVIEIKNLSSFVAFQIYIGSFLFSGDTQNSVVLYDEIQQQIVPSYPVQQGDVLKSDFRKTFSNQDMVNYGSTLEERITKFIGANKGSPIYLVIALRAKIMKDNELLLFCYKCSYDEKDLLQSLNFTSQHFSTKEHVYKAIFKTVNSAYKKYRI